MCPKQVKSIWFSSFFFAAAVAGFIAADVFAASAGSSGRISSPSVCYELSVPSFFDSDGDRTGDLNGITQNLDYINDGNPFSDSDLGCDMLCLNAVFPSPGSPDHDVTEYTAFDPDYGSMDDFPELVLQCHERGIRLILNLPLSDASGHLQLSQAEMEKIIRFWLEKGVDGFCTDEAACQYLHDLQADFLSGVPFYAGRSTARNDDSDNGDSDREDESHVKLAQALNLLTPGLVWICCGEELGMKGFGNGEHEHAPMYWSDDPDAPGMCTGLPETDEGKMKYPSWKEQSEDPYSILSYVKQAVKLRGNYPAVANGQTQPVDALSGPQVRTMLQTAEGENPVLLIINTSDEVQKTDLSEGGSATAGFTQLSGQLHVTQNAAFLTQSGTAGPAVSLPPFGIALLTQSSAGRTTDSMCILDRTTGIL